MFYNDIINNISVNFNNVVKTKAGKLKWKNIIILMLVLTVCVQWCINSSLVSECDEYEYNQRALVHTYSKQKQSIADLEIQAFICDECTASFE